MPWPPSTLRYSDLPSGLSASAPAVPTKPVSAVHGEPPALWHWAITVRPPSAVRLSSTIAAVSALETYTFLPSGLTTRSCGLASCADVPHAPEEPDFVTHDVGPASRRVTLPVDGSRSNTKTAASPPPPAAAT